MITYHNKIEYYGTMAERPDAAVFGVGQCLVAGVEYISNGVAWSGDAAAAIEAPVTGLVTTAGAVSATDTVVGAIGKLVGNVALKADNIITGFTSSAGTVSNAQTVVQAISSLDGNIALRAARITPTFTGTAATDFPTLGAEFLTGGTWTSTDWTGDAATGWVHANGPVTVLVYSNLATIGVKYHITYTVTRSAGSFTIALGLVIVAGITATGSFSPTASSTGAMWVTPTTDFVGSIIISVKPITTATTSTFTISNSASLARLECRASTAATNLFLGVTAGSYVTTGVNNTAVGNNSFALCTSGYNNTAVGTATLAVVTTGYNNSFGGYNAGASVTTGYSNTGFGARSLGTCTTGYFNTMVGWSAGYNVTTGYTNTAIGEVALYSCTTGYSNTVVGVQAAYYMTTGNSNTAVGQQALYNATSAVGNTVLGNSSGQSITTGGYNLALGNQALNGTTSGTYNTAIGASSGFSNTAGSFNTSIGPSTLYEVRPTSRAITAISDYSATQAGTVRATSVGHGMTAGTYTRTISGSSTYDGAYTITYIDADTFYFTHAWGATSVGWWSIITEGTGNTALGYNTGRGITTGSNNTILGAGVTGLPATLGGTIILATGDGVIRTLQSATGGLFTTCVTPNAHTANATLTIANLLTNIVTCTSATAVALTLPTGALTDAGVSAALPVDMGFSWSVINLGSADGAVTMTADTAHTYVGAAVVAIGTSARFTTRKTVANTYVTYRIA